MGRYEIVLPLASGGMATVYLARSHGAGGFGREVALKLMHAHLRDDPAFTTSLLDEARLMVSIRHPNVVSVLDVGDDPRGLFLVMDLIEGDTVSNVQKRARQGDQPIPLPIRARLILDALAGLHAAHESHDESGRSHELIHRDFSPQNLLVGLDGVTRLTDFGVAKAANQTQRTQTGLVKGKASYMSPEQARGLPLDRRCDVWAAGVVAWELVAERRLFRGDNDVATVVQILNAPAPRLDTEVGAPRAVADAIERALQADVEARWPTAAAFRQALLDAFRGAGGVAEHDEVSTFITGLLGERLATRREQATEVLRARRRPTGVELEGVSELSSDPLVAVSAARPERPEEPVRHVPARRWQLPAVLVLGALFVAATVGYQLRHRPADTTDAASGGQPAAAGSGSAAASTKPTGPEPGASPDGRAGSEPAGSPPATSTVSSPAAVATPLASAPVAPASARPRGGGRKTPATLAPSPYSAGGSR